jgi:hypothetical protein
VNYFLGTALSKCQRNPWQITLEFIHNKSQI